MVEVDALSRMGDIGDGSNPEGGSMKRVASSAVTKALNYIQMAIARCQAVPSQLHEMMIDAQSRGGGSS